jgi:hypothetical protein
MSKLAVQYGWLLFIAIILLSFSIYFEGADLNRMVLQVLRDIGIALLSGYLVAIAIEHHVVKRYLAEITTSVYSALYGAGVPELVAKYIEDKFVKNPFREMYKSLSVELRIDEDRLAENMFKLYPVKMSITQAYTVKNISRHKREFSVSIDVQNLLLDCLKPQIDPKRYNVTSASVNGSQVELKLSANNRVGTCATFVQPGEEIRIMIRQERLRLIYDSEVWVCKDTIEGSFTFMVNAPPELLVCGSPTEPSAEALRFENASGTITKEMEGPILPGHGFVLWWRPAAWGSGKGA